MSAISPEDNTLAAAGNRFDTPDGGVLYCSTALITCYLETLARFRPSAAVRAAVQHENPSFMICGGVPADWRFRRVKVCVALQDPLPFLDVEDPCNPRMLTTELAPELADLGVGVLDVAVVRGPNRQVTRAISTWAYRANLTDDPNGQPRYAGLRYLSRMGDHECWAVFEGHRDDRNQSRHPVPDRLGPGLSCRTVSDCACSNRHELLDRLKLAGDTPTDIRCTTPPVHHDEFMAGGAPRGRVQRNNQVSYQVGSGLSYRTAVSLPSEDAEKLVTAARAMNCSLSGLMQTLVSQMELDDRGLPSWYQTPNELQEKLIA